jgi:hypothetical protein
MVDGDIRDRGNQIDIKRCPLFLLTGEYDYSCTAEATLDVAKRTGQHHAGPWPLSNERRPGEIRLVSVAGAGKNSCVEGLAPQNSSQCATHDGAAYGAAHRAADGLAQVGSYLPCHPISDRASDLA